MNMKQSCKALICAIEGELDGRHCTEEQAAAILDHALPSLTGALARVKAELAEAVGLLWFIQGYLEEGQDSNVKSKIRSFISRHRLDEHAQAEQQEAPAPLTCEVQRAICGNCGGSGDVHRPDGEWLGTCPCPAGRQVRLAEIARESLLPENQRVKPVEQLRVPHPLESQGAQAGDERAKFLTDEAYWVSQVLEDIGGMESSWIEEDEVELQLEDDDGNSTICTVSITEFSRRAASLIRELQARAALANQSAVPVYLQEANVWDAPSMSADTEPEIAWRDGFNDARDRVMNAVRGAEHE